MKAKFFSTLEKTWVLFILLSAQFFIPLIYNNNCPLHESLASLLKQLGIVYIFFHLKYTQIALITIVFILLAIRGAHKEHYSDKEKNKKLSTLETEKKSLLNENKQVKDLLDSLEIIVGEKRERFSSTAKKILNGAPLSGNEIFNEITQPKSQMQCINTVLKNYLSRQCNDNTITSYLFDVKNNQINQMKLRNQESKLDTGCILINSDIKNCITNRDIIVIEENKGNTYHSFSKKGIGEIISAICYPVIEESCVKYVLLICSEKYKFKQNDKEMYKLIFDMFCSRIKLEMHLKDCLENKK